MKKNEIDWKLKLMQILECFGDQEGTWYDGIWQEYGVSEEERDLIKETFEQYSENEKDG